MSKIYGIPVTTPFNPEKIVPGGVVSMDIVKSRSTVTFTTKMDDGGTHIDIINLNENEYPVTIVSDGATIPVTWEGFDG